MLRDSFKYLDVLAGYFHEDWPVDHRDADAVIDFCLQRERVARLSGLIDDIDAFLNTSADDADLKRGLLFGLYFSYDPTTDGWPTCRAWLDHVRGKLIARLGAFPLRDEHPDDTDKNAPVG